MNRVRGSLGCVTLVTHHCTIFLSSLSKLISAEMLSKMPVLRQQQPRSSRKFHQDLDSTRRNMRYTRVSSSSEGGRTCTACSPTTTVTYRFRNARRWSLLMYPMVGFNIFSKSSYEIFNEDFISGSAPRSHSLLIMARH